METSCTLVKLRNQRGQAMTEYALILATVAIVVYVAYQLIAGPW